MTQPPLHRGRALAELRRARGHTQVTLSQALGVDQSQVSATERRADIRLSTLARYVGALGGELELTARFGDERIPIESHPEH